MTTLNRTLRRDLENAVKKARRTAEVGATKAVEQLAVHHHEPWQHMSVEERRLRNRLRAHGRQLGDLLDRRTGTQSIARLVAEVAYEHWHRMLFARFLAENDLLIEPDTEMPLSLAECRELAREEGTDWLHMASSFAQRMLPQIFRADDPALELSLPAESRQELERILAGLSSEVFVADDSLGWVYQFWQAEKKEQINKSGEKIGADELPAVTQLFTEDYMVLFLLHNTLGAWWAGKRLKKNPALAKTAKDEEELRRACSVNGYQWSYLRSIREEDDGPWRPAAGAFERWPTSASKITVMDPSMGSGHFLVFALPILVAFRMEEEGLSQEDAVIAVLRDNLHGLEIDPRCTQIAAFNLAFAAWKLVGYRPLPALSLACSGLALGVSKEEWLKLAEKAADSGPVPPKRDLVSSESNLFSSRIRTGLERLYDLFADAPTFGSLLEPDTLSAGVFSASLQELKPVLDRLGRAGSAEDEIVEMAIFGGGAIQALRLLNEQYTLFLTNVPFLGRRDQRLLLKSAGDERFSIGKADLGTMLLVRMLNWTKENGTVSLVLQQSWLYQTNFRRLRERVLSSLTMNMVSRLGEGAFESSHAAGAFVCLATMSVVDPQQAHEVPFLEPSTQTTTVAPRELLASGLFVKPNQARLLRTPDSRISVEDNTADATLLADYAKSSWGISPGDLSRFGRTVWEVPRILNCYTPWQSSVAETCPYGGRSHILRMDRSFEEALATTSATIRGKEFWNRPSVVVSAMRALHVTLGTGEPNDTNAAVIVPNDEEDLAALWAFCQDASFHDSVRKMDQNTKVTSATFLKIPFDVLKWRTMANRLYPQGIQRPESADPTQWLFNGHPFCSDHSLQVAVAKLLGYRWPRQTGSSFMDCPALGQDGLESHADDDGIVCLTSLSGEGTAADRLRALLADAYAEDWSASKLSSLLSDVGFGGKSLDDWLRDGFFEQHCKLFQQRPFVWHICDGLRNGFHALVNYHKLAGPNGEGRRTLEKLLYTYLGDWIDRRRADLKAGKEGADAQVTAAEHLHKQLELILEGEPPFDIFVRWKPLHEQPLGWDPDINDGVRLNIRPFMTARPVNARAKNASILRVSPRINWKKDRGKEPKRDKDDYPWFWTWDGKSQDFAGTSDFDGNRWNDLHYSWTAKQAARERRGEGEQ